ncbi:MAG: CDP-alcohol phosphatidyltransferase family protein [Arenimonas sp.]
MNVKQIPNAITIARMVAAFPLLYFLMQGNAQVAFWIAMLAGLSDSIDGYLAKKFDWRTALGGLLDPIADKLLLCACFIGLTWQHAIPLWLCVLVIGRDIVIVSGAWLWWKTIGPFKPMPSWISKLTTFFQIVYVALLLADLAFAIVPDMGLQWLLWLVIAFTIASGLDYFIRYGRRALRAWRKQ